MLLSGCHPLPSYVCHLLRRMVRAMWSPRGSPISLPTALCCCPNRMYNGSIILFAMYLLLLGVSSLWAPSSMPILTIVPGGLAI